MAKIFIWVNPAEEWIIERFDNIEIWDDEEKKDKKNLVKNLVLTLVIKAL